jgi:tripartite-type tricarboxylate transporter receptor subunit TctC
MITLNITPEQLEAIKIAFAEISNSGEWAEYYNEEQVENVYAAADYFTNLNPS